MKVKYKGEYIVDSSDKTKKLLTKGRFCEDDIEIEASGGGATIVAELGDSSLQVGDRVMVTNLALGNYNLNIADSVLKDNGIVTNVYNGNITSNILYPDTVTSAEFYLRFKITAKNTNDRYSQHWQLNATNFFSPVNNGYPNLALTNYYSGQYLQNKGNVWVWVKIVQTTSGDNNVYWMDDVDYSLEEVMSRTDWNSYGAFANGKFVKGNNTFNVTSNEGQSNYYDLTNMAFVINGKLVWRGCEVSHDKFTAFPLDNYRGEIFSTGVIESLNEDGTANVRVVEVPVEEVTLSTIDSEDYYSNLKLVGGGKDE